MVSKGAHLAQLHRLGLGEVTNCAVTRQLAKWGKLCNQHKCRIMQIFLGKSESLILTLKWHTWRSCIASALER